MNPTPLQAALGYADRGWAVLPCHTADRGSCTCGRTPCSSPAKHPRTARGLHDASSDPAVIRAWWRRWPDANIGVRTGADSGIVVLDVDLRHDGLGSLDTLRGRHGPLPPTPVVWTGGGGRHYWFAHPGPAVRNSAGHLAPGLDIRGDGGYVIAPPSLHASGRQYVWSADVALAAAPDWILARRREPERSQSRQAEPFRPTACISWARTALEGELRRVRGAPEGVRNDTLNRAAFALGQLVGSGHLAEDMVRSALTGAGMDIGLIPREIRATVTSGLRAGSRSPRYPYRRVPDAAEPRL